jgi:hypothetical protein
MRLVCGALETGALIYSSEYMSWLDIEILVGFPIDGAQLLAVIQAVKSRKRQGSHARP